MYYQINLTNNVILQGPVSLSSEIDRLQPSLLANLGAAFPGRTDWENIGWYPEVTATPSYNPLNQVLGPPTSPVVDTVNFLVNDTYSVVSMTGPQIALAGQNNYNSLIASGIVISSTSTPALNGVYDITTNARVNVHGERYYIDKYGTFSNGELVRYWQELSGSISGAQFSIAQFEAMAQSIAQYYDNLNTYLATVSTGNYTPAPTNAYTIP